MKRSLLRYQKGRKETRNKPFADQFDRILPVIYTMVEAIKLDTDEAEQDTLSLDEARKLLAKHKVREELTTYEQFVDDQAAMHPEVNKQSLLGCRICRRCGRHLSAVESITRGLGPVCAAKGGRS